MKGLRDKARVLDELGDKFLDAVPAAVAKTRVDYRDYQATYPEFVVQASPRGLANWIHDRLWYHLTVILEGVDGIFCNDHGVTREIVIGHRYRIRVKRHIPPAQVATYPTPTALEFMQQPLDQLVLEGLAEIHLIVGYVWLNESVEIGPAVLSLRDGQDNVLWDHELPEHGTDGASTSVTTLPPLDEPEAAAIRARLDALVSDDSQQRQR